MLTMLLTANDPEIQLILLEKFNMLDKLIEPGSLMKFALRSLKSLLTHPDWKIRMQVSHHFSNLSVKLVCDIEEEYVRFRAEAWSEGGTRATDERPYLRSERVSPDSDKRYISSIR